MQVIRYTGPASWTGAQWAVNIACILARHDGAPIHMTQSMSMDDAWNARRLRLKFPAFSRNLRVSTRSILLPPASTNDLVITMPNAGNMHLDGRSRGPVFVKMLFHCPLFPFFPLVPCPDPILPQDAYDLHLHLDASLSAAFFGQVIHIDNLTGIPALSQFGPVSIPPFALEKDQDLCRVTFVRGAGLPIVTVDRCQNDTHPRGNLVIFSRLRLPSIPQDVLLTHEPLIRSVFEKLESLSQCSLPTKIWHKIFV